MKYYAVTDDPNELMHFGVKGMKWGVIRTPEQLGHHTPVKSSRPRSKAYQSAKLKLDRALSKGIQNAQARWDNYNSPANKAARQQKREVNQAVRAYKKNERKFEKHVQLARQGRLKYKGISDAEVQRITDRLALERNARNLSGAEGKGFVRRLGESVSNGIVSGVGQGMAAKTSEIVSRKSKLKTQRMQTEQANRMREAQEKRDFKRSQKEQRIQDRYTDKRADRREAEKRSRDLRNEYEQMAAEDGVHIRKHLMSDTKRRKAIADMKDRRDEEDARKKLERDLETDRRKKQVLREHNRLLAEQNDRYADAREARRMDQVRQGLLEPKTNWESEQRSIYETNRRNQQMGEQLARQQAAERERQREIAQRLQHQRNLERAQQLEDQRRQAEERERQQEQARRLQAQRNQERANQLLEQRRRDQEAQQQRNQERANRILEDRRREEERQRRLQEVNRRQTDYRNTSRRRRRNRGRT